jgi:hypothetical protein
MGGHSGKYDKANCYIIPTSDLMGGRILDIEKGFMLAAGAAKIHLVSPHATEFVGDPMEGVWQRVRSRWAAMTGNLDEALEHVHSRYVGWFTNDMSVDDKDALRAWIGDSIASRSTQFVKLAPVGGTISNDIAIVHYSYIWIYADIEGKRYREQGKFTETWTKEGETWRVIGDHGGPV